MQVQEHGCVKIGSAIDYPTLYELETVNDVKLEGFPGGAIQVMLSEISCYFRPRAEIEEKGG